VLPALLACVDGVRDDGTAGVGGAIAGAGGAGGAIAGSGGAGGAGASMTAVATIAPFGTGTVTGTVTFTQSGTDVTVVVSLQNCPDGMHGVHVHQGTSCLDANTQGGHWDMTRGEGIPDVICSGGAGTAMHTRVAADPTLAWSIGGAPATNLVGHVFVVHDPGDLAPRIGCGAIAAQ
jgi:Cu-Zn family superoxide dismutase